MDNRAVMFWFCLRGFSLSISVSPGVQVCSPMLLVDNVSFLSQFIFCRSCILIFGLCVERFMLKLFKAAGPPLVLDSFDLYGLLVAAPCLQRLQAFNSSTRMPTMYKLNG